MPRQRRGTDQVIMSMTAEQTRSAHMYILAFVYIPLKGDPEPIKSNSELNTFFEYNFQGLRFISK